MATTTDARGRADLTAHGIRPAGVVHWNPTTALLYMRALKNSDGVLAEGGAIVFDTGVHTGRSPKDKFIVREPGSEERIWWSDVNQALSQESFDGLREKVVSQLEQRDEIYVVDAFAGADPAHRIAVRVVTDLPYHALFAKTLFIEPTDEELRTFTPGALVLHAPSLEADPAEDGTRSGTFVVLHPTRTEVLIGGTFYGGEIKKSIFTVMNDRLPLENVFPMHCSANVGDEGDVAIFFGLSGTGASGVLDLDDDSKTENTRAAYKLEQIANALPAKRAGHPSSVIFLTADAFGILPPIARLTRDQAMYYFLSGFTSKLAGTEIGVTEPQPTFSTCFGAPFLPQPPGVYARMLGEKLDRHDATVWLVNTGWTGGPFGEGERMPIVETRALLSAALAGQLADATFRRDPVFGFEVPVEVPGVVSRLLDPRSTWRDSEEYDRQASELARMFRENFEQFAADAGEAVVAAGPRA